MTVDNHAADPVRKADGERQSSERSEIVWRAVSRVIALTTVLSCLFLPWIDRYFAMTYGGQTCALLGIVAVSCTRDGDMTGLGFRCLPQQCWGHWLKFGLKCGVIVGAGLIVCYEFARALSFPMHLPRLAPDRAVLFFFHMCVLAPVYEEVVFRSLLTFAVQPTLGERGTILFSGVAFALTHVVWGVASPENQIAGFLLAWAYLRSGSILVPIAIHSAGNLIALGAQIANWYLLPQLGL